jgi:hypothetical protein
MKVKDKQNLRLLLLAASIGLLGSYSANYFFAFFDNINDNGIYHVVGILSAFLFFTLLFLFAKVAE